MEYHKASLGYDKKLAQIPLETGLTSLHDAAQKLRVPCDTIHDKLGASWLPLIAGRLHQLRA